jgi:hypothetical protein
MTTPNRNCLPFLLLLICASAVGAALEAQAGAQTATRRRDPGLEDWKPATLPADALAYGAALEENAPPQLKKWCENYAQKEMPKQKIDPRATMAVVDKEFSKASDEARDAVIFLLDYLAYKHEDIEQSMLAMRIRHIDDEAYDITRRMIVTKENQERGMSTTAKNRGISPQQAMQVEEDQRKSEQQLREMAENRKLKRAQLEMLRKRVDGYLKVMAVTHPRMNGVAPEVLRTIQ